MANRQSAFQEAGIDQRSICGSTDKVRVSDRRKAPRPSSGRGASIERKHQSRELFPPPVMGGRKEESIRELLEKMIPSLCFSMISLGPTDLREGRVCQTGKRGALMKEGEKAM